MCVDASSRHIPPFDLVRRFTNKNNAPPPIKVFDGRRVATDSIFMVYYHDLSVAIIELGPEKLLLNCNIIEIYEPIDVFKAMGPLRDITKPVMIKLEEMLKLMGQCDRLEEMFKVDVSTPKIQTENEVKNISTRIEEAKQVFNNQLTLLSGIIPGTKWCGTGDIANSYHDLGEDSNTDMCCRAHDLCPVKIRAYSKKYDLSNNSLYTKSHCICDDIFYECMKRQSTRSAQILANIYFNIIKVPCLQGDKEGWMFRNAKEF